MEAINKVVFCKTCLMPNTRPRIVFSEEGFCNACLTASTKTTVDWGLRKQEFDSLVSAVKDSGSNYHCVVPWSGGKDSSSVAYRLKFQYGLNPLLVTFSPLIPNELGHHNREELLKLGFDHMYIRPNQRVSRSLARRFFVERGNPKIHWDAGVNSVPVKIALDLGIPLVFYAEHGESEYGGHVLHADSNKFRDANEVFENQIGDNPVNWVDETICLSDLEPYIFPEERLRRSSLQVCYFGYFFPWDVEENFRLVSQKIDFRLAEGGRTQGTFTNYDSLDDKIDDLYYHMQFVKFGFGRAARDASRLIYRGKMARDKALALAKQYDAEFPSKHLEAALDYLSMTAEELTHYIDLHRNDEIWTRDPGGQWQLNFEVN
jgi:N-acetyl sugar amidotransferase